LTDTSLRPSNDPVLERPLGKGLRPRFAFALLRFFGWRVVLSQPVPRKCVVVFYPHTSNWDFPAGLLAKWATGINFRWIGKHTLFETPLGRWFARWGGIPVDRADAAGFVDQVAAMFASHDDFALVITPEGNPAPHRTLEERLLPPRARRARAGGLGLHRSRDASRRHRRMARP